MVDTARLPVPGSDDNAWGDLLNEFLLVSHNSDGTEKEGAPLILPINLGSGKFVISDNGAMTIAPVDPDIPLTVISSNDDAPSLRVLNAADQTVASLEPSGLYLAPKFSDSVAIFVDGSEIDGSGMLMDLENGRTVFKINSTGATFIQPIGDNSALVLQATSDLNSGLQVWQDSDGNSVSWINADGTPGGALAGGSLPSGWNTYDATGEINTRNPDDGDAAYNAITFVQPTNYGTWNAFQVLDDVGNYLGGFDGSRFQVATPNQAVARLSAEDGIMLTDSNQANLFSVNSSARMVLGDGEVLASLRFQRAQGDSTLYVQGPGEAEHDIFQVANRTGGGEEDVHIIFSVDPNGATSIFATGADVVPLALHGSSTDAISNLQEWRDSDANLLAWVGPDGTPGGTLEPVGGSGSGDVPDWIQFYDSDDSRVEFVGSADNQSGAILATLPSENDEGISGAVLQLVNFFGESLNGYVALDSHPDMSANELGVPRFAHLTIFPDAEGGEMATMFVGEWGVSTDFLLYYGGAMAIYPNDNSQTGYGFEVQLGADMTGIMVRGSEEQTANIQEWTTHNSDGPLAWIAADGTPGGTLANAGNLPSWFTLDLEVATVQDTATAAAAKLSIIQGNDLVAGVLELTSEDDGEEGDNYLIRLDSHPDYSNDDFGNTRESYISIIREGQGAPYTMHVVGEGGDEMTLFSGGAMRLAPNQSGYRAGLEISTYIDMVGLMVEASTNPDSPQTNDIFQVLTFDGEGTPLALSVDANGNFISSPSGNTTLRVESNAVGFMGATPATQQTAADGDSLIDALQAYGLLDGDASWAGGGTSTPSFSTTYIEGSPVDGTTVTNLDYAAATLFASPSYSAGGFTVNSAEGSGTPVIVPVNGDYYISWKAVYQPSDAIGVAAYIVINGSTFAANTANTDLNHDSNTTLTTSTTVTLLAGDEVSLRTSIQALSDGGAPTYSSQSQGLIALVVNSSLGNVTSPLVVKDTFNEDLLSVTGGGPSTVITMWATGEAMKIMSDGDEVALSFFGASPSWQQGATDGSSLVTALVNYGLLSSGSSWDSHAANTDHDFFITGDGTLPITATDPGVGFGVETENHNAHIELASPADTGTAYIDLTAVGTDAKARVAWDENINAFSIVTAGHALTIDTDGLHFDGDPVGGGAGTTQAVAWIDGQVAFGSPADFTYQLTQSFPIDGATNTYGNYADTWSSHTYPFESGTVFTISPFSVSGIDSRVSDYTFNVSIFITPADTPTNTMVLVAEATLSVGSLGDSATLNIGDFDVSGVTDGTFSYDSSTGELSVLDSSTGLYVDVQVTGTWGNLVNGG